MIEADQLCERIAIIDRGRIVALDTPEGLKQMVGRKNGSQPTLEDVFLELTGRELIDDQSSEETS
jgi:ABC-2 type transport system ATP-binding protein